MSVFSFATQAALKNMKAFGVERDLEVYRALIDIMPKEKYVPQTKLQAAFFHYPKHQFCIVEVLSQMTENGVVPDSGLNITIFEIHQFPTRVSINKKILATWLKTSSA